MEELCTFLLSWFMSMYENEEILMSPEVYDRAVFTVGVGVPMLVFIFVLVCILMGFRSVFRFIERDGL